MTQPPSASVVTPDPQPPSQTPASTRKPRRLWVWAIILLLFGLLFYWVINQHNQPQQGGGGGAHGGGGGRRGMMQGPASVVPATAKQGSIGVYLDAIGTVTPVYTASITAQATGVITAVHYREGQLVRKGDPLIDLDARQYEAQLAQAEGALERDRALLAQAQMDLDRYRQAWSNNAIPRQQLEDQEKIVLQDQGTVKNDEGQVKYDQVQVAYCHITSPITGRVGLRLVDPGNLVTSSGTTPLVVITQSQPITVIFTVAEDSLSQVIDEMRHGNRLSVEAWDRDQQKLLGTGKLATIDNQIDTTTGTVKLRSDFDNRNNVLFPNQFVNTRLLVRTLDNQVLIPSSAIQHNGDTAFVYLIQDKKAVMRTVKPGVSDKGNTAVEGIQAGDVVANSSFEKLQNGSSIVISKVAIQTTSSTDEGPEAP